jgi:hypothetical protein
MRGIEALGRPWYLVTGTGRGSVGRQYLGRTRLRDRKLL